MMFKRMSLSTKLMAGSLTILLIPLTVVSVFCLVKISNMLQTSARQEMANTASDLAELAQMMLVKEAKVVTELSVGNSVVDTADYVARNPLEDSRKQIEQLQRKLSAAMEKIGKDYETIYVTDASGRIYADGSGGEYTNIRVGDRDYFQAAQKTGQVSVGSVLRSKKTNNPVTVIAAPVFAKGGKFQGILAVAMKLDPLIEQVASKRIGRTGYSFIVDNKGLAIAHPDPKIVMEVNAKQLKGMEQITESMLNGKTGAESYVFRGVEKIGGYAPVKLTGWSVVSTQDKTELMAPVRAIRRGILIISGLFLLLSLIASFVFARNISRPITRVAEGLQDGSDQVTAASAEVSSASQSLAEGTSQQAASLEETSSALEELASMTRQNADNASQTNALMGDNSHMVQEANQIMDRLTTSMKEISKASEETQKIIRTIDEVAFQTNLLALNAAVEAARAGEAGSGFAVVADEVRNLAMRAGEAAKNTADLIEGSVKKINEGSGLVQQTATALLGVSDGTTKMKELVAEIAAASSEQAQGLEQITRAVAEMDKVVQQNAANAEESASAAEELSAQSEHMRGFVTDLISLIVSRSNGHPATDTETSTKLLPRGGKVNWKRSSPLNRKTGGME